MERPHRELCFVRPIGLFEVRERWLWWLATSTHAETNAESGGGARRPRGRMDPRAAPRVRGEDPPRQVHRFDEHTVVLWQSRERWASAGHVHPGGRADILA